MSTFNMNKETSSKIKEVSLALIFIGSLIGTTLSTTVNAAPVASIESAVNNLILAQGKTMITELNTHLQQSIKSEIDNISTQFSLNNNTEYWLVIDKEARPKKTLPKTTLAQQLILISSNK